MYYGITNIASNRDYNDSAIIQSWLLYKIDQFLKTFTDDLNGCVNNEFGHYYPVESIVEPAFYFGLSMSRIGADFRPQIIPIINKAICKRFALVVNEATNKWVMCLVLSGTPTKSEANETIPLSILQLIVS